MKQLKALLSVLAVLVFASYPDAVSAQSAASVKTATYKNPLPIEFGDPYVLHVKDGKYYMYGTGGVAKNGFAAYSSIDLVNWKNEGQVYYASNKNGWSDSTAEYNGAYWAPEVYERNGKFYMFYSAQWKENPNKDMENFA